MDILSYGLPVLIAIGVAGAVFLLLLIPMMFRVVVSTNEVHIVQSSKHTISYGKGEAAGNTYYIWPSWLPRIGRRVIVLPTSVFDEAINDYPGYDKDRLPFHLDIMAFFRIADSNTAAQRVASFGELLQQLKGILQGAIRSVLASHNIQEILEGRSQFGVAFTKEVDEQLKAWGVENVKCIELMDIRDAPGSAVIANIMAKKKSEIEMQSRMEVAGNRQKAEIREIEANREVGIQQQEAEQKVGMRTAEKEREVGVARQQAMQTIQEEARVTAEKNMAVKKVEVVRNQEIVKEQNVVAAQQDRLTAVERAEGVKTQTTLVAEGTLAATMLTAQGIEATGRAKAEAEKALQLAPVQAQITLAKEIGENQGYQKYLIDIRTIEANQVVGVEQAKALTAAEIKVIANSGNPVDGVKDVMGLFTPKGGMQLGAMVEAFKQTETGAAIIGAVTKGNGAHT